MSPSKTRYLAIILLLLLAGGASLLLPRLSETPPTLMVESEPGEASATPTGGGSYVSFIDVSGWYQVTPYERAVAGPVDLSVWEELSQELPHEIGPWYAQGEDTPADREMTKWFKNPDVALTRYFADAEGHWLYLSVLGNKGSKSFTLFEHTPLTCYPANGWNTIDYGVEPIEMADSQVYVQRFVGQKEGKRLLLLYWYLWTNPERDPTDGVLAMRIYSPVEGSLAEALEREKDFFRLLFPVALPWHRFG